MNKVYAISRPQLIQVIEVTGVINKGAIRMHEYNGIMEVYNPLHDSWIGVKIGDYIRVDNPSDIYPIDRTYFQSKYDLKSESELKNVIG